MWDAVASSAAQLSRAASPGDRPSTSFRTAYSKSAASHRTVVSRLEMQLLHQMRNKTTRTEARPAGWNVHVPASQLGHSTPHTAPKTSISADARQLGHPRLAQGAKLERKSHEEQCAQLEELDLERQLQALSQRGKRVTFA
eukprot:TRINITY_DN18791_c0_g1_i1.p2 TRINITY_DN18791_c0_g1~~TRINITY_DN18791_c0_g1_i1.p2  ORF type:complete len:141 (-),score=15.79 TRINITY_DN18791_c0_g1_i1:248-670(-)